MSKWLSDIIQLKIDLVNHSYFFVHSHLKLINFNTACSDYLIIFPKLFNCFRNVPYLFHMFL